MNAKRDSEPVRRIQIDAMRGGALRSHPDFVVVEVVRVGQPEAWQARIRAERSAQRSPPLPTT